MKTNVIEYWIDSYNAGYIPTKVDIEMLIPVDGASAIFADENGNWYYEKVTKGVASRGIAHNQNFMSVEEL